MPFFRITVSCTLRPARPPKGNRKAMETVFGDTEVHTSSDKKFGHPAQYAKCTRKCRVRDFWETVEQSSTVHQVHAEISTKGPLRKSLAIQHSAPGAHSNFD